MSKYLRKNIVLNNDLSIVQDNPIIPNKLNEKVQEEDEDMKKLNELLESTSIQVKKLQTKNRLVNKILHKKISINNY